MRLEQLRALVAVVRQDLSVSRAAEALAVPQPVVSRQVRGLERELGVDVFVRRQKRLRALTRPGAAILRIAERMLQDAENLARIGREFSEEESGSLTVATTHTQARYALPALVERFVRRHPGVQLVLRQGNPAEVASLVANGDADICIGSESAEDGSDVAFFACYEMQRVVLTPPGHPLLKARKLTLETLARYPVITYDAPFAGRSRVVRAFAARGLTPRIVLSAVDTDVIKAYVEQGLGIAIVAHLAYDRARDTRLRALDASALFEPNTIFLGVRRNDYLRGYMFDFIEMYAPHLDRDTVGAGMQSGVPSAKRSRGERT